MIRAFIGPYLPDIQIKHIHELLLFKLFRRLEKYFYSENSHDGGILHLSIHIHHYSNLSIESNNINFIMILNYFWSL